MQVFRLINLLLEVGPELLWLSGACLVLKLQQQEE